MAASKAVKKSGTTKKSVAKRVASAAGAARAAVKRAVVKATKKAARKTASKKATATQPASEKAAAKKAGKVAKKVAKKKAVKSPGLTERLAARKAKKAARVAKKTERVTKRAAKKAAKQAAKKVVKKIVKKVAKKPVAKEGAAKKTTTKKATGKEGVAKKVAKVAKRVVAAAGEATQRARKAVKKVVKRVGKKSKDDAAVSAQPEAPVSEIAPTPIGEPVAGDMAPDFEVPDQDDEKVSSASLAGQPYVVYFYPKDNTPGCTREAQGFRDEAEAFAAAGVRVLGVSPDSTKSHRGFREKYELRFTLLSDPERTLAKAYGAYGPKKFMGRESIGIIRSTFLVDAEGTIRRTWRGVRVDGHVAEVLEAARELAGKEST